MTVLDQIAKEAQSLPSSDQRRILMLARELRTKKKDKARQVSSGVKGGGRMSAARKAKLHPALRAIVGLWKDRTDLPRDGAAASRVLRQRMMRRGRSV